MRLFSSGQTDRHPFRRVHCHSFRFDLNHSDFFRKFSEIQIVRLKFRFFFFLALNLLEISIYTSAILVAKFRFFSVGLYSDFFSHIHSDFVSDQSGRSACSDQLIKS